jgi:hypothetical protein
MPSRLKTRRYGSLIYRKMKTPDPHMVPSRRSGKALCLHGLLRNFALLGCGISMAFAPQPLQAQSLGDIAISTSSQIISDGVSFTNAKAIPSAVIDYTTQVANRSVSPMLPDALIVTNPVPQQLILYVGDMAGPGSGPVVFTQGTVSSALACVFGGIADGSDCLEFSNNDGATFDYQPVPDADGYDVAVTHIRVRPQGSMAPALVQPSSFVLRYRMKVK